MPLLLLLLDHGLPFQEEPAPEQEMSKQEIKKSRSRTRDLMGPKVPASTLHKKYWDDEQEEKEEGDDAGGDGHEVLHLHLHHGGALAQGLDDQGVVGSGRACPVLRRAHVRPVLGQGGVHDQQLASARREKNWPKKMTKKLRKFFCTWQLCHPPATGLLSAWGGD